MTTVGTPNVIIHGKQQNQPTNKSREETIGFSIRVLSRSVCDSELILPSNSHQPEPPCSSTTLQKNKKMPLPEKLTSFLIWGMLYGGCACHKEDIVLIVPKFTQSIENGRSIAQHQTNMLMGMTVIV